MRPANKDDFVPGAEMCASWDDDNEHERAIFVTFAIHKSRVDNRKSMFFYFPDEQNYDSRFGWDWQNADSYHIHDE